MQKKHNLIYKYTEGSLEDGRYQSWAKVIHLRLALMKLIRPFVDESWFVAGASSFRSFWTLNASSLPSSTLKLQQDFIQNLQELNKFTEQNSLD
jgi:hypothetical protein